MGSSSRGFDALGYPGGAFADPADVVRELGLTLNEKRAILASWASDACAVEAAPALRRVPGGRLVTFDNVMDALRLLDRDAGQIPAAPRYRRVLENRIPGMFGGKSGSVPHGGQSPPIS